MIFNMRAKEVLGVIESDSTNLIGSYDSTLKINKIGGVCVQGENPSPTNPQEIKKSVVSEIRTHGRNYCPIYGHSGSAVVWLSVKAKAKNYVAYGTTLAKGNGSVLFEVAGIKNGVTTTISSVGYASSVNVKNISTQGYDEIIVACYSNSADNELKESFVYLYDEPTTETLHYEPYVESVITLSQPIELYGVGDVQDTIEDGKVIRRFAELTFDGSSDEPWSLRDTATGGLRYACSLSSVKASDTTNGIRSINSNFIITKAGGTYNKNNCYTIGNDSVLYCVLNMTETLNEWKSYLQANPMTVVYELTEEITEDLTLTDQLALSWLKTFHGVTYVEFDGEVQPTLNSEYATNLEGAITLQAHADNKIGKANTLVNRAEDETQNFEVRVEHGLIYLYKDDALHGIVGANNVTTNGKKYNTLNLRADTDADFIALTSKKDNSVCYFMNINKVPFTANEYTDVHYFAGDARFTNNLTANDWIFGKNIQASQMVYAQAVQASQNIISKANITADNELRGKDLHFTNMGVNGGVAQPVEWVYDQALGRYVLCTVTGQ